MTYALNEDQKQRWSTLTTDEKAGLLCQLYSYGGLNPERGEMADAIMKHETWEPSRDGNCQDALLRQISIKLSIIEAKDAQIERLVTICETFLAQLEPRHHRAAPICCMRSKHLNEFEAAIKEATKC